MARPAQDASASGFPSAGTEEPWTVAALADVSGPSERVKALPVLAGPRNPAVALRRYAAGRLPGDVRERTAAYAVLEVRAGAPVTDSRNRAGAARRHGTPSRPPRGKRVAPLRFCQVLATPQHRGGRTARLPLSRRGAAEEANHFRKTIEAALAQRGPARP